MEVIISGRKLGTLDSHLSYDGSRFRWVKNIPKDSWSFGFENRKRDLGLIAEASGKKILGLDTSPHGRSYDIIFKGREVDIPWMHVMPNDAFRKQLQNLLDQLWRVIQEQHDQYYMNQFLINREVLMTLQRPVIDVQQLDEISETAGLKRGEILKFMPKGGNISPKTVYSQVGSITGRLTVSEGPNILILKREYRRILKSKFKGGKIIQIDISSLEPRIALAVAGKSAPSDIYDLIGKNVLHDALSRDQVKVAVLSAMYGASSWSLSKQLPEEIDSREIIDKIKKYFEIFKLQSRLKGEIKSFGHIKNLYGRLINSSDSFVNHFLQSSGVDVSFNVFSQILSDLNNDNIDFSPIYVIHDALILDIPPGCYKKIKELTSLGYKVDKLDCIFPVKVEIIRE